ncbi:MAG TPA: hypothetical protein VF628_11350 [Allosphingosinicella sp.]|jgi:cytochrome c biogenesis protein CcdA
MVEISYALYLAITIGVTVKVAQTLSRNGEIFLVQCFGHNRELARSTNHLLVVGFYLVNTGFITLTLSLGTEPTTLPEAIRFLSSKVGLAVLVLGGMHFFNMSAIAHFGRKVNTWFVEQQDVVPTVDARMLR